MKFFVPKIDGPFTVRGTEIRPDDTPELYLQKLARITLDEMFQLVGVLTTDGILLECSGACRRRADTRRRDREAVLGNLLVDMFAEDAGGLAERNRARRQG